MEEKDFAEVELVPGDWFGGVKKLKKVQQKKLSFLQQYLTTYPEQAPWTNVTSRMLYQYWQR